MTLGRHSACNLPPFSQEGTVRNSDSRVPNLRSFFPPSSQIVGQSAELSSSGEYRSWGQYIERGDFGDAEEGLLVT